MTTKEITEGKKLIAEFLEYKILFKKFRFVNYNSSNEFYWEDDEDNVVCDKNGNILPYDEFPIHEFDELPFDELWDWLMPVVEKIRAFDMLISINISDNSYCRIQKLSDTSIITTQIEDSNNLRLCIWKAVVEFIKWYNEQSKPKIREDKK